MKHTNQSKLRTFKLAAGSAALLLLASSALAQNSMMSHGGMGGHRSMGGFSGSRPHSSFAPMGSFSRPMGSFSAARMPPPPTGMQMPPAPTNGVAPHGTVGTTTNGTNMASTGTFHHRRFFDDDDDFFFAAFPFPDPFFVDVIQPVYISPNGEYWYWCPSSRAYFPWVRSCAVPWQPVPAY